SSVCARSPRNHCSFSLDCRMASGLLPRAAPAQICAVRRPSAFHSGLQTQGAIDLRNFASVRTRVLVAAVCSIIAGSRPSMQTPTLPSGWLQGDVGAPVVAGSGSGTGGTITVSGAGTDIGGSADEFHFVY